MKCRAEGTDKTEFRVQYTGTSIWLMIVNPATYPNTGTFERIDLIASNPAV